MLHALLCSPAILFCLSPQEKPFCFYGFVGETAASCGLKLRAARKQWLGKRNIQVDLRQTAELGFNSTIKLVQFICYLYFSYEVFHFHNKLYMKQSFLMTL